MKIHCAYDKLIKIKDLTPHPKNPNKHSEDQLARLAKIIEYQGIRRPVRVSRLSGYITAGHGLVLALSRDKKCKEVPVNFQDYENEEQEYADIIADNSIASWAELDLSSINLELPNLGPDFDIEMLGLKDFELEPADKFGDKDADAIPTTRNTQIAIGDLFSLGRHRLLCGDSTDRVQVERLMSGEKADMVFTDPPYGVLNVEWDRPLSFEDVQIALNNSTGPVCMFNASRTDLVKSILNFPQIPDRIAIWRLTSSISPGHGMFRTWQPIFVWRADKIKGWDSIEWINDSPDKTGDHPTQKPIALIEKWISSCGAVSVMDPFLGSGSTLIACEKTNRKCFGSEIDPQYVQVCIDRWERFTGQKAVKL